MKNDKIYIVYDVDKHKFLQAFFDKKMALRWKELHSELRSLHLGIVTIDCQAELDYLV